MSGSVTATEMVFSSVPATVNLMVSPNASSLAGGLVSTNGQGFAFGPETYAGTSFQFAVAGPSYTSAGASRSTDGFYYVCVPATYLAGGFDTTAADAAANWQGTRDGAAATTSFTTGSCGLETRDSLLHCLDLATQHLCSGCCRFRLLLLLQHQHHTWDHFRWDILTGPQASETR